MFWWITSFMVLVAGIVFIGPVSVSPVSHPRGPAVDQAKMEWKKAKDKFLIEVKKLSQNPALTEKEKEMIRTIEKSWKGYDISFQKYVMAALNENRRPIILWLEILTGLVGLLAGAFLLGKRRSLSARPVRGDTCLEDLARQATQLQQTVLDIKGLIEQAGPIPPIDPKTLSDKNHP